MSLHFTIWTVKKIDGHTDTHSHKHIQKVRERGREKVSVNMFLTSRFWASFLLRAFSTLLMRLERISEWLGRIIAMLFAHIIACPSSTLSISSVHLSSCLTVCPPNYFSLNFSLEYSFMKKKLSVSIGNFDWSNFKPSFKICCFYDDLNFLFKFYLLW